MISPFHSSPPHLASQPPAADRRTKVLLVANTGWNLFNFRRNLAIRLRDAGYDVVVVSPVDRYVQRLRDDGFRWVEWKLSRSGINPLVDFRSLCGLYGIYRHESPDMVHHFTIKSILYGTVAAHRAAVPCVVNNVTGLGHVFTSERLTARLLRPAVRRWYVWALTTRRVGSIFQNADDLAELVPYSQRLVRHAVLTNGSGVDLDRFAAKAEPTGRNGSIRVIFAGRLLREKGIVEFLEAGRICQQRGVAVELIACGQIDAGNPSSLDERQLANWQQQGVARFVGHVERMEDELATADIVVLPSYREGNPRVLLEAAAMGKPIIASDVPGCRDVVVHGENGLLVPPRDSNALATAMQSLSVDESLRQRMGKAGRRRAIERFDEQEVIRRTLGVYASLRRNTTGFAADSHEHLKTGVFVLSLDLELAWGTRGRPAARRVGPFLDGTRNAIRGLLALFDEFDVRATWAMVGALLLGSRDGRKHRWLDDPCFADIPAGDSTTQPHWYAEDVLESLLTCPTEQEIGCHTLTHQFVDVTAAGRERFRVELRRFRELFDSLYLQQPTSFIFPKAKMAHFDVLADEGFRVVRGPESKWFETLPGTLVPAGLRWLDAKFALPPVVDRPWLMPAGLWMIPSSQFYSPFMSVGKRVSVAARVRKAIRGLRRAARTKSVFHLWTHPFNLGVRTDELLGGLRQILVEARRLADRGDLEIASMDEFGRRLDSPRFNVDAGLNRRRIISTEDG